MSAEPNSDPQAAPVPHRRRPRYAGKHPRKFQEKYKELNPARYASDVQKVLASGKTPAGMHRSIMVSEILECLSPRPGEIAVDATLGYGGHARVLLERLQPGGRLIGLDVDPIELPRTEERVRAGGFSPETFMVRRSNFAGLAQVLGAEGITGVDIIIADLGVSSMQLDNPDRGFTYKESGPLDMRMNPTRGEPASRFLEQVTLEKLVRLLEENADEPHALEIAGKLHHQRLATTQELARLVRNAVIAVRPRAPKDEVEASVRRTFQALRIAVNEEFSALDQFLRNLPLCLNPGGRAAILTFHSGEDRRVKKAFQAGHRQGLFSAVSDTVTRATASEVRDNPRASSAKLRWAVRA